MKVVRTVLLGIAAFAASGICVSIHVTPRKVKPKVTRPTGPANVTIFVVSRSELGVKWDPPLFDGGKAITKYLLEWDTDKSMTGGIVSPSNHYNSDDGPVL
jgi:hypothetical protein